MESIQQLAQRLQQQLQLQQQSQQQSQQQLHDKIKQTLQPTIFSIMRTLIHKTAQMMFYSYAGIFSYVLVCWILLMAVVAVKRTVYGLTFDETSADPTTDTVAHVFVTSILIAHLINAFCMSVATFVSIVVVAITLLWAIATVSQIFIAFLKNCIKLAWVILTNAAFNVLILYVLFICIVLCVGPFIEPVFV